MLSLEPPILEIDGITVYRDHAIADQFYYLAPPPKIARDGGKPMFDLFAYTVDLKHSALGGTTIPEELGAGFLTMGVNCELTDLRKQRLIDGISARLDRPADRIMLLPTPYHSGSVRVIALDKFSAPAEPAGNPASDNRLNGRPTFVEEIVGAATPNLMGDLRTIFSLSLSQAGVVFLQGLYEERAAPVGVIYDLKFYGLRPSVQTVVHADLSRIHQHFGGGLQVQYQWLKAEVSAGLDFLEQRGAIEVELTSQAVGEEAQKSKELALSLFKDRILQEMFQPAVPQVPANLTPLATAAATGTAAQAGAATNASAQASLGFTLKFQRTEELKVVHYSFSERSPEQRVHSPQAFLALMVSKADFDKRVHQIDLQHTFFETLEVLVTGPTKEEFEALRIRQVEATLTYGEPGDADPPESRSLLFRPDTTGDKTFAVKRRGRKSLAYRYSLVYEFVADTSVDADSQRLEFRDRVETGRTLLINPTRDFGVLQVEVEPGRIDASIKQADVALEYKSRDGGFIANQIFRLGLDGAVQSRPNRWQVRTRDRDLAPYTATSTFVFDDGAVFTPPPLQTSEPLLRIDSPFRHRRQLLIKPNVVSQNISQLTVEVEYDDPEARYQRRFATTLQAPFESKEMSWPILDANRQKVRYRVTTHEPGFISEGEWEETEASSIIAGAAGSRLATVTVRLIGGSLEDAGLDALMVKLHLAGAAPDSEDTVSLFFEPSGSTSLDAKLTLPPGVPLKYRFQTTAFKRSSEVVESGWKEETNKLLVISTRTL
jgi:hypothetical protein